MARVFVCSPFRGELGRNIGFAKEAAKYAARRGHEPFVPHLLYPQFLDDSDPQDRITGIEAGCSFMKACEEVWVFTKYGVSSGMAHEIRFAILNRIPIEYVHEF